MWIFCHDNNIILINGLVLSKAVVNKRNVELKVLTILTMIILYGKHELERIHSTHYYFILVNVIIIIGFILFCFKVSNILWKKKKKKTTFPKSKGIISCIKERKKKKPGAFCTKLIYLLLLCVMCCTCYCKG